MAKQPECLQHLVNAGISLEDAIALRRISMTLQRWFELECGDSDAYKSCGIVRGRKERNAAGKFEFIHDDNGKPYMETHMHNENQARHFLIADREAGARKRLAKIMKGYPGFTAYVQTDPRGCALYILRPGDVAADADVSSLYTRGIAVYR